MATISASDIDAGATALTMAINLAPTGSGLTRQNCTANTTSTPKTIQCQIKGLAQTPGVYSAKVVVNDRLGGVSQLSFPITIEGEPITPTVSVSPTP